MRELLGDGARFERHDVEWVDESAEAYAALHGGQLPAADRRPASGSATSRCTTTYLAFLEEVNEADDGGSASAAST